MRNGRRGAEAAPAAGVARTHHVATTQHAALAVVRGGNIAYVSPRSGTDAEPRWRWRHAGFALVARSDMAVWHAGCFLSLQTTGDLTMVTALLVMTESRKKIALLCVLSFMALC